MKKIFIISHNIKIKLLQDIIIYYTAIADGVVKEKKITTIIHVSKCRYLTNRCTISTDNIVIKKNNAYL